MPASGPSEPPSCCFKRWGIVRAERPYGRREPPLLRLNVGGLDWPAVRARAKVETEAHAAALARAPLPEQLPLADVRGTGLVTETQLRPVGARPVKRRSTGRAPTGLRGLRTVGYRSQRRSLLLTPRARARPNSGDESSSSGGRIASRACSARSRRGPARPDTITTNATSADALPRARSTSTISSSWADRLLEEVREQRLRRAHGPGYRRDRRD